MPKIRMSELRAGLASGKITEDDVVKLRSAGYGVVDDESGTKGVTGSWKATPSSKEDTFAETPTRPMGGAVIDAMEGAGKRIIETGYNVAKGIANVVEGQPADTSRNPDFEAGLKPGNLAEKVGKVGADVGAFALADKGLTKVIPLMATAPKIVQLGLEALRGATAGAAVTKAGGGTDEEAMTTAAVGGLAPIAIKGLALLSRTMGKKILNTVIRPSIQDTRDGFNMGLIEKYNLGGSLDSMAEKTHTAITDRAAQLNGELQSAKAAGAQVDLAQALADTEQELLANRAQNFGKNKHIADAIKEFTDDLGNLAPNGSADIVTAQTVKRATGNLGAWQYGSRDPAANATELVANTFYTKLRVAIENAAPNAKIADINKQIGELIPVENAIIRRIPVAARNNALSLGRIVALASGHPALLGTEIALKSGVVGNALLKTAQAAEKVIPAVKAGAMGAASGSIQ